MTLQLNLRRAAAVLALAAATASAQAQQVKLMTGPQGGSWYPLGGAIKNLLEQAVPGAGVQVLPGAGIANVKAVNSGKVDMGFANSVSTVDGLNGKAPFDEPQSNVCNVATLYPQYFQVVALADAGIAHPNDFKGHSLAAQKKGNTGEAITGHLLQAHGLSYDDMSRVNYGSYTDSVALMKDDNAQIFTLGTTVPAGAIMDLAAARDIKMVAIDDDSLKAMQGINPGYQRIAIPAGSYPGQDQDVPTIGYATHVIARCDLDPELVYQSLKAMVDNKADLAAIAKAIDATTPAMMATDTGVPMHPGAAKYYKEQGL